MTPEQAAHTLQSGPAAPAAGLARRHVPRGPGLYAWWASEALSPPVTNHPEGPTTNGKGMALLYVGKATNLAGRVVGSHLRGDTSRSTLRRAISAWMGPARGWRPIEIHGRRRHDEATEVLLTNWLGGLSVSWVEVAAPELMESEVIRLLRPPLNHDHNRRHPNWAALDAARAAWRRA